MSGFKIPLDFSTVGEFYEKNRVNTDEKDDLDKSIKESITNFINLMVNSPYGSFKPNTRFGFSLNNCYFENPNSKDEIKGKKILGKSDNVGNFANDMEKAIKLFETRLQSLDIKTDYDKAKSRIAITINGVITETRKSYKQELEFFIWKKQ